MGFAYAVCLICFVLSRIQYGRCECSSNENIEYLYHNYSTMTNLLRDFTACNNNLTMMYSIGKSVQKRELWVVKITAVPSNAKLIPNIKLLANIHGNEAAGREILLHFINYLVKSYWEGNPKVMHLLQNNILHILPSLNPDGFEAAKEGMCTKGPGRHNVKDMDLNRSFPDFFRKNLKPLQPETRAIAKWMKEVDFILSASLHGGAMVANYPFESTKEDLSFPEAQESKSPDDDVFQHLALVYSKTHPTMHLGEPCPNGAPTFTNGITNGAAWYPLTGGMQDYNYAMHGCMEVTLEVSCCKYPVASQLQNIWRQNRDALMEYCIQAGMGVRGTIKDIFTTKPIRRANLTVDGRDMTFVTSSSGQFFRILLPGEYQLKIQVEDYKTKLVHFKVNSVKTGEFPEPTILDIFLTPGSGEDVHITPSTEKSHSTTYYSVITSQQMITEESTKTANLEVRLGSQESRVPKHYHMSGSNKQYLSSLALSLLHTNLLRLFVS